MDNITVSVEAGLDLQQLFSEMSPEAFREMLERTLLVNEATGISLEKLVVLGDDGVPRQAYQIRLTTPD